MAPLRRVAVALAVAGLALLLPMGAAGAEEATIGTSEEAWYQPCVLPAGCEALPPASPYPAQTFHVALRDGAESARAYLQLDLTGVPADAELTGGTLILPLAPEADGTSAPETAAVIACLAPDAVDHAEASFAPPPEVDCDTRSAATFDAGAGELRIDLAPLAGRWSPGGVAAVGLLPADGAEGSWRVVVSGPDRDAPDSMPPTATLTYDVPEDDDDDGAVALAPPTTRPARPIVVEDEQPFEVAAPRIPDLGLPDAEPPPEASMPEGLVVSPTPAPGGGERFRYPAVWLLPLALLVVGGLLGSVLTRPIRVS